MRWVTLTGAGKQLNKQSQYIRAFSKMGCFERRKTGFREQFALEPDYNGQVLLDRFYAQHRPCNDKQSCLKVKKVVDLLRGRPQVVVPQAFLKDAVAVMLASDMSPTVADLRSLTGASVQVARRHLLDWSADNQGAGPSVSSHFSLSAGDHEALVLARLPVHLRTAPGTYLADGAHPDDKPSEKIFARLNSINNPVLFEAVTIDTMRLAALKTNEGIQDKGVRAFGRFDRDLVDRDARDPFIMRERLETRLGPRWTRDNHAEGNSCETVMRYQHVYDRLQDYIECVVPESLRSTFRAHQLTMPAGHEKFFRQVKNAVTRYQKACAASRQSRIESILDNPLEFLLVGRLRLLEHVGIRDACRLEIDELIATGKALVQPWRFQHSYETRLINDGFRRCKQTIHLAIWSWDLLHHQLRQAVDRPLGHPPVYAMNKAEDLADRSGYVIAYLGVTPQTPGEPTQTPLIAEVADSFALCSPGDLTIEQRSRQAAAFKRWELSEKLAKPAGLTSFEKMRRHACRDANALLKNIAADGSEVSVLLLPHEEFTHGLMFAHSGVFIAADAGCRTGETLLAPSQALAYEPITDPATGDVFKRFESVGKFGLKVQPMMSPDTFRYLTDMIVESARRWYGGKLPPPVAPNYHFQERKITTVKPYAFTTADGMIGYSQMAVLTRVLYFGWHGLKGHDVRHLFNAMGRRAGIPHEVRQRILNHSTPGSTDLYGLATPNEISRRQIQLNRQTSDNMAKLLENSAEGMSPEMRVALRELRRAELNVRYYQEGGWHEEAEQVVVEVRNWAEKLARATADYNGGSEVVRAGSI